METNSLYLREMRQSDHTALCKILQDEDVMYAYEGAFSDAEVQQWLDRQFRNYTELGFGLWDDIQAYVNHMDTTLDILVSATASDAAIAAIEKAIKKHDHVGMVMIDNPPKV